MSFHDRSSLSWPRTRSLLHTPNLDLSVHQTILKKIYATVLIIINYHIRMISEKSCDWSYDAENFAFEITGRNYILKKKSVILNSKLIGSNKCRLAERKRWMHAYACKLDMHAIVVSVLFCSDSVCGLFGQYLDGASSSGGAQGREWWAPDHHRVSVSLTRSSHMWPLWCFSQLQLE